MVPTSRSTPAGGVVACPGCGARNRIPLSAKGSLRCPKCSTPRPWVVTAGDADFDAAVDGTLPTLVDLWAPWCGPCRQVSPLLDQLAADRAGRLKLVKVNVDESPRTQARFGVQAIPTLLLFQDGREVGRQQGALPLPRLRDWVDRAVG